MFVHKTDVLSGEYQDEFFRQIQDRIVDYIYDRPLVEVFQVVFPAFPSFPTANSTLGTTSGQSYPPYLPTQDLEGEQGNIFLDSIDKSTRLIMTSTRDASLLKGWSKVVQKLIEGIYGEMENFMDTFQKVSLARGSLRCG